MRVRNGVMTQSEGMVQTFRKLQSKICNLFRCICHKPQPRIYFLSNIRLFKIQLMWRYRLHKLKRKLSVEFAIATSACSKESLSNFVRLWIVFDFVYFWFQGITYGYTKKCIGDIKSWKNVDDYVMEKIFSSINICERMKVCLSFLNILTLDETILTHLKGIIFWYLTEGHTISVWYDKEFFVL